MDMSDEDPDPATPESTQYDAEACLDDVIKYIVGEELPTSNTNLRILLSLKWIFSSLSLNENVKQDLKDQSSYFTIDNSDDELVLLWSDWLNYLNKIIY